MCKTETKTPPKPSTTPGSSTPAGGTTGGCHPTCTLASQTVATSPADRARTKIGVGEEVNLTVTGNPATWAITSGGGALSPSTGARNSVKFTADDNAGSVTITATGSGCSCVNTITLTIVQPANWTMIRTPGTNLLHTQGQPNCGWYGTMFIHPNDVNFYRVETNETNSQYVNGIGSYTGKNGRWHQPETQTESAYFLMNNHTETDGSRVAMMDNINNADPGVAARGAAVPFIAGSGYFPITWQWKVLGNATVHAFPVTRQEGELFSNGRCESRKGGNTEFTMHNDPTSTR